MARLTNEHLHNEINLVKKDVVFLREGQEKILEDLTMIKKTLLGPDNGTINFVNWKNNQRTSKIIVHIKTSQ